MIRLHSGHPRVPAQGHTTFVVRVQRGQDSYELPRIFHDFAKASRYADRTGRLVRKLVRDVGPGDFVVIAGARPGRPITNWTRVPVVPRPEGGAA